MANEEIFYLLSYDKQSGKWRSADDVLGYLIVASSGESGPVHYVDEERGAQWRPLEDGMETDLDFDNTETLSSFLRDLNS